MGILVSYATGHTIPSCWQAIRQRTIIAINRRVPTIQNDVELISARISAGVDNRGKTYRDHAYRVMGRTNSLASTLPANKTSRRARKNQRPGSKTKRRWL